MNRYDYYYSIKRSYLKSTKHKAPIHTNRAYFFPDYPKHQYWNTLVHGNANKTYSKHTWLNV